MILTLNPRRVLRILLVIITVLTVANICVAVGMYVYGHARLFGLARLLNINRESNIPTFFSSMQLAFAAFVLWVIAETARSASARFGTHWLGLAVIFAYLAVDESVSVHETIGDVMRAQLVLPGILYYAWYIPYGLLLVLFAVVYWKFFWHLPAAVRMRFACAGAIFIVGAAGLEVVGSYLWSVTEWDPSVKEFRLAIAYSVEELLEMLGIAFFIYAALDYAATQGVTARIAISAADAPSPLGSKQPQRPLSPARGTPSQPSG
ncbi:MAG: hypothetical protein ACT4O5_06740 [Gammaproteobacteria bacterium]